MRRNIIIGAVIYTLVLIMFMSYSIVKGENNYYGYKAHLESVKANVENNQLVMAGKNETKAEDESSLGNTNEETSSVDSEDSNIDNKDSNTDYEDVNEEESDVNTNLDSQSLQEEYNDVEFERVLRKGLSGDDVKKLQHLLKEKGYYDGEITGNMGHNTVEALKRFQQSVGELQDGVMGPSTRDKVLE